MNRSTPGLPVHHYLPEFTQTHLHRVGDAIQPSHPLSSPSPTFNLSQQQGLFQWVSYLHQWPKYWSFSFSISPSNEYSGLTSFRMDWLDLLAVQGTLKSLLQHRSLKASILWHSAFFIVQLSHPYMTTGKTMALTRRTFVTLNVKGLNSPVKRQSGCWMNKKSRPYHKLSMRDSLQLKDTHRLKVKGWKKILHANGNQNKVCHCFPIYLQWSDGTRWHDLRFLNVEL